MKTTAAIGSQFQEIPSNDIHVGTSSTLRLFQALDVPVGRRWNPGRRGMERGGEGVIFKKGGHAENWTQMCSEDRGVGKEKKKRLTVWED